MHPWQVLHLQATPQPLFLLNKQNTTQILLVPFLIILHALLPQWKPWPVNFPLGSAFSVWRASDCTPVLGVSRSSEPLNTSLPKICAPVPSHFLPGNVTFRWDWSCHSLLFPTDKGCPLSSELAALGPSSASVEESESQRAKWLLACSEHHAHREMWFDDVTLCVHARNRLYERFHLFPSML